MRSYDTPDHLSHIGVLSIARYFNFSEVCEYTGESEK